MTEPTQSPSEEPELTVRAGQVGSTDRSDPSAPSNLGYPGVGNKDIEPPEKQLPTFDEMLPTTRAFYRSS